MSKKIKLAADVPRYTIGQHVYCDLPDYTPFHAIVKSTAWSPECEAWQYTLTPDDDQEITYHQDVGQPLWANEFELEADTDLANQKDA